MHIFTGTRNEDIVLIARQGDFMRTGRMKGSWLRDTISPIERFNLFRFEMSDIAGSQQDAPMSSKSLGSTWDYRYCCLPAYGV